MKLKRVTLQMGFIVGFNEHQWDHEQEQEIYKG